MSWFQLLIILAALALWAGALWRRDGKLATVGRLNIKFTHVLPAILQLVLFAYWAIYWSGVVQHLPVIGAQIALAYLLDFLLAWSSRRPYRPSLGPLPIVLSMNLFVWFPPEQFFLGVLVVAVALWSKATLVAGGRHVFNPSVFGISCVAVLCILLPAWFRYQDISHDFDRPPHMTEVILLLALIPQLRLRIASVAVGAAAMMLAITLLVYSITGYIGGPDPFWPPWLLAITLLAGDPATIPSGSLGRLLFGVFLGAAYYVISRLILFSIGTDFFSKILAIPLANLLVPRFENAAVRLSARWPRLHLVATNRAYVGAWVVMSVLMVGMFR